MKKKAKPNYGMILFGIGLLLVIASYFYTQWMSKKETVTYVDEPADTEEQEGPEVETFPTDENPLTVVDNEPSETTRVNEDDQPH